ncbi:MAG: NADH-quinone oxidoreductase subunit H [Candidatus Omnitrophica bacterium]|nr:NADH-quinone oxidoreductase subunit H [Candidatus Omnitrophota bacterium]
MSPIFLSILQVILVMALAPGVSWFIKKLKGASQNRVGPALGQVYFDLIKLFRKEMVVSETASWVFHAAPFVLFASTLLAAGLVPFFWKETLLGFAGDAILLVYLLALGRFFIALAAMDAGTSFGGMGSSREMFLSSLTEPALLLSFFAFSVHTKTTSLQTMAASLGSEPLTATLFFTALIFGAMLIVTLVESARIPVDNPATHLELTMVHEAMILEYSGRYLALIEWSHQIRQLLFFSLLANLFFPFGFYLLKVFALALLVGWIEIHSAKLRLFRVPDLIAIAFVLALLSLLGQLIIGRPS